MCAAGSLRCCCVRRWCPHGLSHPLLTITTTEVLAGQRSCPLCNPHFQSCSHPLPLCAVCFYIVFYLYLRSFFFFCLFSLSQFFCFFSSRTHRRRFTTTTTPPPLFICLVDRERMTMMTGRRNIGHLCVCVFRGEDIGLLSEGKSVTRSSVFCHVNESVLFVFVGEP